MSRLTIARLAGFLLLAVGIAAGPLVAQTTINQYSLGTDIQVLDISSGPDGNLWYTVNGDGSAGTSKVGRITQAGTISEFILPDTSRPVGIVAGPDGAMWFAESGSPASIGRIDPSTFPAGGSVTHFTTGITAGANPFGICVGPDGNLWFTERNNNAIARITTGGAVTEFPTGGAVSVLLGIVAGPDGNLWFSDNSPHSIWAMTPAGSVVKHINTPTAGNPAGITVGPDGRIWFVEFNGNKVGVMATTATLTTDITEYATPTTRPFRIVSGPDGALWFTENNSGVGGKVGRITTSGTITEHATTGVAGPYGITLGPDRAIWFTERDNTPPKVGQLLVDCVVTVPTITGGGAQCAGTTLTLTASGGYTSYQWSQDGNPIGGETSATYTKTSVPSDTGSYTVTGTNGSCTSNASAPVSVTVAAQPVATNGGAQAICALGTTASLGGNTPTGGATGSWSIVTGGVTGTFSPDATTPGATFTHTAGPGPITLRWTVTNPPCPDATADLVVSVSLPPTTATAGAPQTICALGTTTGLGGNTPTVGTGTWSVVSGGTGSFAPNATTPNATFTHATGTGPITLRWTISNAPCAPSTADVTITITPAPTTATAGGPQTICALGTTAGLGGNTPTVGTGTWTVVSGGTGTFSPNATTPNATFTHATGAGPVLLAWTISNGSCTPSVANVTVTITQPPTTATAGGPQTICALGTTTGLGGNTPTTGSGTWSVVSGGTGTFSPNATTPGATFTHTSGAGPVVLAWTISNGTCTPSVANVTVTITPAPTTATAGGPQTICALGTTTGLGGNTPSVGTGTWTVVSGGTGTFSPNATTPNATFTHATGAGPVLLAWTISNGTCTPSVANVTVTVTQPPTTAAVGGPQTICALGTTTGLGGNTPTTGTGAWSVVSGGTGTFNPNATTPNATFTHATGTGPVTLRWTISNGTCTPSTADVTVTITPAPTTATVGGPQTICALGTTAGLGGNTPTTGTGAWSVVSGGTGTFNPNATTPNATFTHATGTGPITLRWTISNGSCTPSTASVTVTITQPPTTATVGGPQTICALGTTTGLGGNTPTTGTGTWSVVSGGTGTFSPSATTPGATFTHTSGTGPVLLAWTISNGTCAPSVANVTITINQPPTTAAAGGPQTICALGTTTGLGGNTPTTGTGAWSVVSGGTGTFSPNATTPNATFTHVTGTGPVTLRWTISNPPCAASTKDVVITITQPPTTATVGGPQTICALGTTTGLGGNTPTTGTGTWSVVSGGTGTFSPSATTPNATFTHVSGTGPVLLAWTISNGTCTPSAANVTITITQPPTAATAGGPQTICALGTTTGLGGNTPTVGTGTWSVVSGGTGTFTPNASAANATFTHLTGTGPVLLAWTISNGSCAPTVANVTVTVNQPPTTATAGGAQAICNLGTTVPLGGNTPTVGTGAWSVVSGGTGTFSPNATTPNATFTHATGTGPITLRWTISNAPCTASTKDVVVTINQPPTAATAGGPQTICALGTTTGLGGNTPVVGTGTWSVVSGGTGTFSPNATTPNATFTHTGGAGPVVLAWTISNGSCTPSAANVTVTVNQPPTAATAGGPQTICNLGSSQPLGGNAPTTGTGAWTVVSGGTGTFAPNATTPNATFTHTGGAGPVVLAWTISNPPCAPSAANVTLTIGPNQTVTITAPASLCASSTATASVPDAGVGTTYTWSVTNGTIVSGQGTRTLVFSTGPSGSTKLDLVQVDSSCTSTGTLTLPIDTGCAGPLSFVAVTPCRRIDTRFAADAPQLAFGEQRTFVLTGGPCTIPSSAKGVSVNVAVTQATAAGDLRLFATGTAIPPSTTINFAMNQTRANRAIVALSSDGTGRIDVKNDAAGTVHVIIDVNGYFR